MLPQGRHKFAARTRPVAAAQRRGLMIQPMRSMPAGSSALHQARALLARPMAAGLQTWSSAGIQENLNQHADIIDCVVVEAEGQAPKASVVTGFSVRRRYPHRIRQL